MAVASWLRSLPGLRKNRAHHFDPSDPERKHAAPSGDCGENLRARHAE
jgi:hypothetical protein